MKFILLYFIIIFTSLDVFGQQFVTPNLFDAILSNNIKQVKEIITKNHDAAKTPIGYQKLAPIYISVANGRVEITKLLLENGADPNVDDSRMYAPLIWATYRGSSELIELLLNKGANMLPDTNRIINMREFVTPLQVAASQGNVKIIELLLDKGVNVDTGLVKGNEVPHNEILGGNSILENTPPIACAAGYGQLDAVSCLLNHKAKLTPFNDQGITPLHLAAAGGYTDIIESLLKAGTPVDGYLIKDTISTPLQWSLKQIDKIDFNKEYIQDTARGLLFFSKENLRKIENIDEGKLKFINNPCKIKFPEIIGDRQTAATLLISKGANIHRTFFSTPLILIAAEGGVTSIVDACIKDGESINRINNKGETPLHKASLYGNLDTMRYLLEHGAIVDAQGEADIPNHIYTGTPLQVASSNGKLEAMKLLLECKAKVDSIDSNMHTPLFESVLNNHEDAALLLLAKGANPISYCLIDGPIRSYSTPLHCAIENGNDKLIREMVAVIGDFNIYDSAGRSLLYMAVENDNLDLVKILIAKGAKVNNILRGVRQPIHAVKSLPVLQYLLDNGADPNKRGERGDTLLHAYALIPDKQEFIKLLLKYNADPTIQDVNGMVPLEIAMLRNNTSVINLLTAKIPDIEIRDRMGETLLLIAARTKQDKVIIDLLKRKALSNVSGINGVTPMHWAAINGNIEAFKALLSAKGFVNAVANDGQTVLHWSVRSDYSSFLSGKDDINKKNMLIANKCEIIKTIIKINKSMVNARDIQGRTPIFYASNSSYAELLSSNGATINISDINGKTPLHVAVTMNNSTLVQYLINKKASVSLKDNNGKRPIDIAIGMKYKDIEEILKKAEPNDDPHIICNLPKDEPVFAAIDKGDVNGVSKILHSGVSPDTVNLKHESLLMHSVVINQLDITKVLLGMNADVKCRDLFGNTVLHLAVKNNSGEEIIKQLLAKKADVNAINLNGQTPLHIAASTGNVSAIQLLLANGANVIQKDYAGETPIHLALLNRKDEAALKMIIKLPKNTENSADLSGLTLLDTAACQISLSSVQALLDRNANPNIRNLQGLTAIQQLPYNNKTKFPDYSPLRQHKQGENYFDEETFNKILLQLIKAGAKTDVTDADGLTPLLNASDVVAIKSAFILAESNLPDKAYITPYGINFIQFMLIHNLNWDENASQEFIDGYEDILKANKGKVPSKYLNALMLNGMTYLHLSTDCRWSKIVPFLIQKGFDPNARDNYGRTPLFYARNPYVINQLVKAGANLNALDNLGYTPYGVAKLDGSDRLTGACEHFQKLGAKDK